MNAYESAQLDALTRWQNEPPPPVARWFGRAAGPASQAVQNLIPTGALRAALAALQSTAGRFNGRAHLLRQAGVERVEQLRQADLALCDRLARSVGKRASVMAGSAGAVLGVAGAAGLVADVPALLVLAFRTIQRVGLCYGETLDGDTGRRLALAIFALASANTVDEKRTALAALARPEPGLLDDAAWRDGIERAAERELAKEAAMMSLNNLAMQAGRHLAGARPPDRCPCWAP